MFSHSGSLIGFLCFISHLTGFVLAVDKPQSFFIDVQLSDSFSGTTNCTDPNHWFMVEADVFIPQGADEDVYLTVPNDFTALPNDSFALMTGSKVVGSIDSGHTNTLKVSLDKTLQRNTTASLNFLVQLTADAKKKIKSPGARNYSFEVSTGASYNRTINYVSKDITTLASNGGISTENNTAWFTADIPLSMLDRAATFTSYGGSNSSYAFDTNRTTLEIVVEVDAFNRPLRSYPFTAVRDKSDSSRIQLLFNSKIDGGKYVRVKYYTKPLKSTAISNTISLNHGNGLSKRDSALTVSSSLYAGSQANVQSNQAESGPFESSVTGSSNEAYETFYLETKTDSALYTEIGTWVPISTISSTSVVSSQSVSDNERVQSSSVSSSVSSPSSAISSPASPSSEVSLLSHTTSDHTLSGSSGHSADIASTTTASSTAEINQALSSSVRTNLSDAFLTYSLMTVTLNGEVVTFTSLYPVSTVSGAHPTRGYYSNSTSSFVSSTSTAEESSHVPESTETADSREVFSAHQNSSLKSSSGSASMTKAASLESSSWLSKSSLVKSMHWNVTTATHEVATTLISRHVESYQTYSVMTKDEGAAVTYYTSMRALSTLGSPVTSATATPSSKLVDSSSSTSHETKSTGSMKDQSVSSTLSFRSNMPVTTVTKSQAVNPSATIKTTLIPSSTQSDSLVVTLQTRPESSIGNSGNSSVPITDSRPINSLSFTNSSSLAIQTQLTSADGAYTSLLLTMYEGGANRMLSGPTGLASFLVSFVLLWI